MTKDGREYRELTKSEREHIAAAERQASRVDWWHSYSDDGQVHMRGAGELAQAHGTLDRLAQRSDLGRDAASAIWDRHAPPEFSKPTWFVPERDRRHAWDARDTRAIDGEVQAQRDHSRDRAVSRHNLPLRGMALSAKHLNDAAYYRRTLAAGGRYEPDYSGRTEDGRSWVGYDREERRDLAASAKHAIESSRRERNVTLADRLEAADLLQRARDFWGRAEKPHQGRDHDGRAAARAELQALRERLTGAGPVRKPFSDLNEENRKRAAARFVDANRHDGYLYELDIDGKVLSRRRMAEPREPSLSELHRGGGLSEPEQGRGLGRSRAR